MADKPNKTEQGRQERVAEKAARAKATQGRRDSADAAQSRSEQRKGKNVDEGSAGRAAGFSAREANAGLTLAGNDTTAGRDDFYSNLSKPQASWASFDSGEMKAGSEMAFKADVPSGGGGGELYAFKIIDDGDGTVSVTTGTVNTVTATGLTPTGKPTALWLKVTFVDDVVTAAVVDTTAGTTSETSDARQIATITWGGTGNNTPTIAQGIKGSQSIASCGATHQWGTLYS